MLAAQQTNEAADWYQGTADAVRQQHPLRPGGPLQEVLILSGDQLYRMDFRQLLKTHRRAEGRRDHGRAAGAAQTRRPASASSAWTTPAGSSASSRSRKTDGATGRRCARRRHGSQRRRPGHGPRITWPTWASTCSNAKSLLDLLTAKPLATDFGKEVFPRSIATHRVQAHLFDGYWEDLGTIKSYHEANLALAGDDPPFDFHSPEGVIYTRMRYLPASRSQRGHGWSSASSATAASSRPAPDLERCVVGVRSRIGRNVTLRDTVLIGADRFETDAGRDCQPRARHAGPRHRRRAA